MKNKIYEKNGDKWSNIYYENEEYIILNISKAETNESYDVLINKEDFNLVKQGQWKVNNPRKDSKLKDIYNITWTKEVNGKKINYNIYQYILGTKYKKVLVDHINMNRFDNRRENLRIVNESVNAFNQEHKGYNFDKGTGKYLVRIRVGKKDVNIGRYATETEAEIMYLKACILIHLDEVSHSVKERIAKHNITLTKEDYQNKYIIKLLNVIEGNHDFADTKTGRCNPAYDKNIKLICSLKDKGYSYHKIAITLRKMNIKGLEKAHSGVIKQRYLEYTMSKN